MAMLMVATAACEPNTKDSGKDLSGADNSMPSEAGSCPFGRDPAACTRVFNECMAQPSSCGDCRDVGCWSVCLDFKRSQCLTAESNCRAGRCNDSCQGSNDPNAVISDGACPEGETCTKSNDRWSCRAIEGPCRLVEHCDLDRGSICLRNNASGEQGYCSKPCRPGTSEGCGPSASACVFAPGYSPSIPIGTTCEAKAPPNRVECTRHSDCPDGRACEIEGLRGLEVIAVCTAARAPLTACGPDEHCTNGYFCDGFCTPHRRTEFTFDWRFSRNDLAASCQEGGAQVYVIAKQGYAAFPCGRQHGALVIPSESFRLTGVALLVNGNGTVVSAIPFDRTWRSSSDGSVSFY